MGAERYEYTTARQCITRQVQKPDGMTAASFEDKEEREGNGRET